ncbi:hypothetical protein RI129_003383 [Pyrocoelia pectoralis]|uniref:Cytochrome P450 n=1 Tax=Pyrocoelia pectoralis TaxID=417401 RepID=A0AAN7VNY9_9COLE
MLIVIVGGVLIVYLIWHVCEFKRRYAALSKMAGPSSIELFRNILFATPGKKWQQRRKMLSSGFHFNILRGFIKTFNDVSTLLVEKLNTDCTGHPINIFPVIGEYTLYNISETAMGTKLTTNEKKSQEYVKSVFRLGEILIDTLMSPWLQFFPTFVLTSTYWKQRKLLKTLHEFTGDIIQKRKKHFASTHIINSKERLALLDILISAQRSMEDIDDDGIREEVDTFMFEGHDTVTSCICFTLLMISNHAEIQNKILEELDYIFEKSDRHATFQDLQNMSYLDKVINETLRLCPSVTRISRSSEEDIQLPSGYTIPKGCIIDLHIYDLHQNPKIYPNPEKFDPERFSHENVLNRHPYAYLPFSAGPRNCIGQKYAILEVKIIVSSILRKFRLQSVDTLDNLKMIMHLVLKPSAGIKIKFEKRTVEL